MTTEIPLHAPTFDAEDEQLVLDALRSTWVSTGGPYIQTFEKNFAEYVGAKHAVSVANGTVGLQLCLETLKRQRGISGVFEVIVPTLSFIATANSVIHAGGQPVFVDCEKGTLNVDVEQIHQLIQARYHFDETIKIWKSKLQDFPLLAVMPAHIMGWTCDMRKLKSLLHELSVPVIEDAAEALGSRDKDSAHVGMSGIASVFSFNGNKIITTGGGGMVVTNDDEFADRVKHLSTTAKTDGLRYVHDESGYNHRMVNLLAALGVSQLKKLDKYLTRKCEIAVRYTELLKDSDVKVHVENQNVCNNWIINLSFPSEERKERALKLLLEHKIQCRPLWTPAHQLSFIRFDFRIKERPEFPGFLNEDQPGVIFFTRRIDEVVRHTFAARGFDRNDRIKLN
ncbi:MAG: aminotransferase DegT [Proteobacteria bacterium]|nr:MAG: aminotransferase DegT [Pseudomonadota bacterium]